MGVNACAITALLPVSGDGSIGKTYPSDSVSGASPMYHSSGLTKITDIRRAAHVQLTRYFSSGTLSIGTSYSKETDYLSRITIRLMTPSLLCETILRFYLDGTIILR